MLRCAWSDVPGVEVYRDVPSVRYMMRGNRLEILMCDFLWQLLCTIQNRFILLCNTHPCLQLGVDEQSMHSIIYAMVVFIMSVNSLWCAAP